MTNATLDTTSGRHPVTDHSRPPMDVGAVLSRGAIAGRAAFPWFVNPKGPNQIFELWIHPVPFGLVLVPFFLGFRGSARR